VNAVVVTGWSALTSAGVGVDALARQVAGAELDVSPISRGVQVQHVYEEPLPEPTAHALADFRASDHLGRKGTSSYDRATALAVVCCQEAIREARIEVDDASRTRVGVVLGTSLGSLRSTSDFTRETLVQDRPYLVNPILFPNTVMNRAAGQVAIRFGLRGVNVTIAGGTLAFLSAVRYASKTIERGYADVMLTGAVEEFTPHRAWACRLTGAAESVSVGEAAGVFVLSRPQPPAWVGAPRSAEVLAVLTGYGPGGETSVEQALVDCVNAVLRRADVAPDEISTVFTGETRPADRTEYGPVVRAIGREPRRVMPKRLLGECDAAAGAVALALLLAAGTDGLSLLTARGSDGAVGAAIVRRYGDARADRG
jgi:3-oxoacyl-[acyl-carrier-protein] synthase II